MVSSKPWPHFNPGKDPVPIVQEVGWAPGPDWTGGKSRPHRDSIQTELPGPQFVSCNQYIMTFFYVVPGEGECLDFVNTIIKCMMIFRDLTSCSEVESLPALSTNLLPLYSIVNARVLLKRSLRNGSVYQMEMLHEKSPVVCTYGRSN